MNTERPHDVIPAEAVQRLPPEARRGYVEVPVQDVARVQAMTQDQRARYVANLIAHRRHPLPDQRTEQDLARIARAAAKRERRASARSEPCT